MVHALLVQATVVDVSALWKIVLAAFVAAVGGVLAVVMVIAGLDRYQQARAVTGGGAHGGGPRAVLEQGGALALAAVGIAALAAGLVAGFLAMTHKG